MGQNLSLKEGIDLVILDIEAQDLDGFNERLTSSFVGFRSFERAFNLDRL